MNCHKFTSPYKSIICTIFSNFSETCLDKDIDYEGNDLGVNPNNIRSVKECQEYCEKTSNCIAFTWQPFENKCFLKRKITRKKKRSGLVSGMRYCDDPCIGIIFIVLYAYFLNFYLNLLSI